MNLDSKKNTVFLILAGFFITNAIIAELIGGKIVSFGPFDQSVGILPWPIVFLTTDLINEYYGRKGVVKLSFITVGLIAYAFLVLFGAMIPAATSYSDVSSENFNKVFGASLWIIVGSIIAFILGQVVDAFTFQKIKSLTQGKQIWLRATGSTVISQLVDTFVVQGIAFVIPGKWSVAQWLENASWGYVFKLIVALCLIPFIYLFHYMIDKYLEKEEKHG
jgi:queuosine precursor transporter